MNWTVFFTILIGVPLALVILIVGPKLYSRLDLKLRLKYGETVSFVFKISLIILIGATLAGAIA